MGSSFSLCAVKQKIRNCLLDVCLKCLRNVFKRDVKEAVKLPITREGGLDPYSDKVSECGRGGRDHFGDTEGRTWEGSLALRIL